MSTDPRSYHRSAKGKVTISLIKPIRTREELALAYTPGVAIPAQDIAKDHAKMWELTGRRNRVAIISDGSAVLGLGNIGPEAALPVMEGKAALFKEFANVDAFPIVLDTNSADEIVKTVEAIAPSFGGINLEDIAAPQCFEVEEKLKRSLTIPVFHDDQHGTAIVVLAALMNALKVIHRDSATLRITISGAGAAGTAITRMLLSQGYMNILICDSHGIISRNRDDLNEHKTFLAAATNPENMDGSLANALEGSDVFIGVSRSGLVTKDMISSMAADPIVFALANPIPEIMPEEAHAAGAAIVASGRSDLPNQVNNLLAFPGIFRGALDSCATEITEKMKLAAAHALAECVSEPGAEKILPSPLEREVAEKVAKAVISAASTML